MNMKEPRVFAVQAQAKYDVSKASSFGNIVYLCQDLNPLDTKESVRRITTRLKAMEYNSHRDYILMTGKLLECSFLLAIAARISQAVRILVHEAKTNDYTPRVFGMIEECTTP